MAYACLTLVEHRGSGLRKTRRREAAAAHFGIDIAVLNKLGELTSTAGDKLTARKFTSRTRPLQGSEQAWIEEAVRMLIRRVGEVAADPSASRPRLTMANLPRL